MRSHHLLIALALAVLMSGPAAALAADQATAAYEKGNALLKTGDFKAALKAYAQAARADGDTPTYRQAYMQLRRIMKMRKAIMKESNEQKWWHMAVALRSFYYQNELYKDLLGLAKQMHEKKKEADSATILADAYLMNGKNAEAEAVLNDTEGLTVQAQVLKGIALARQEKTDAAKAVLTGIKMPEKVSPRFMLDIARLKVLCGDANGGNQTLVKAFENTVPSALPTFKEYAKKAPDFEAIAKTDAFAQAMKTESKVPESDCSGGTSCGSCPSRGSCGSASAQSCAQAATH